MTRFFLFLFLLAWFHNSYAQTRIIDSLKRNIAMARTGQEKIQAIFRLCEERSSLNTDTLTAYAMRAKEMAARQGNRLNSTWCDYYLSTMALKNGYFDSTLAFCDTTLKALETQKPDPRLTTCISLLKTGALIRSSRFKEALSLLYSLLHDEEKQTDTLSLIKIKTSIGWVHMEMDQNQEAMNWFYKAAQTSSNESFFRAYPTLFSNMSSTLNNLGKYDSAFYYVNRSVAYSRQTEQLSMLANALNIRADIHINTKNNGAAEQDLAEALEVRKKIGDLFYLVSDLAQLSNFYATTGQTQKGIQSAQEGLSIAYKQNLVAKLPFLYRALAENYKRMGDHQNYAATLETIMTLKDSQYKKNSAEALAELQAKYDLQKKENLIIQQRFDLRQKNYLFYASLLLLLFASLAGWFLFRGYKRKEKLKLKQLQEEDKIRAAISINRAEENERRRIAADLHDNIGAYASAIRADVEKVLILDKGENKRSLQNLEQHSLEIINSLRDTIWVLNKENITITGIGDRIKNHINKMQPSYDHIQISLTEEVRKDRRISSQSALSIFRIVQEALHNALKHSRASLVEIILHSDDNAWIKIRDNGGGIESGQTLTEGNGLKNMRTRANEAGFQLHLSSEPGKGTTLLLDIGTTN